MLQSKHLFTEKFTVEQVELKGKCVWEGCDKNCSKEKQFEHYKNYNQDH